MSTSNTVVSAIFEEQVPAFIREEHDNFVQFLKSYYEFMELGAIPTQIPLIVINPDPTTYTPTNAYAGDFQVGEIIEQRANPLDLTEVTASAKIFAWSGNATSQTAIVTAIGGTQEKFIRNYEILGQKSGSKYFPSVDTIALGPGALRASLDLPTSKDINEALETYIAFIKKEIGANLPKNLFVGVDDRTVLKNIRDFYKARGTEDSFKFLFRLLYGEDIEIYLPETDMLRASDADWKQVSIIRSTIPLFDAQNTSVPVVAAQLTGRTIRGNSSKATATVESARELIYNGYRFAELEVSGVSGTFITNEILRTTNIGDGTTIEVVALGLVNDIDIDDGGSNYAVGDVVSVAAAGSESGKASGAIIKVATVNASSGAITSLDIVEPGYDYVFAPTLDITGPHNAEAGATRFAAGPLEEIYYNDFSDYEDANSFFSESDNRGARSNVGTTSVVAAGYANVAVNDPSVVTANSILNFTTIPFTGLKGHWKMNSYHDQDVRINTLDGTFGDGNDPVANSGSFRGPRLGDVTLQFSRQQPTMQDVQLKYQNFSYTSDVSVGDRDGANSYNFAGWAGFSPVVFDSSGSGHHARVGTWQAGIAYASSPTVNLHSEAAFANSGIYGTGNSLGSFAESGLILMPHDDIRNSNTQTWIVWVKPYQGADIHVDTFAQLPTIINRGTGGIGTSNGYWAITANTSVYANTTGFVDARLTFAGATWDNTNIVTDSLVANTNAEFTGNTVSPDERGNLRLGIWNMIALTIDYDANADGVGVGNVYFFNTEDGLLCSNGFSIDTTSESANVSNSTWPRRGGVYQGRAVKLGDMSYSANGDSFSTGVDDTKAIDFDGAETLWNSSYNPIGIANEWSIQVNLTPGSDTAHGFVFRSQGSDTKNRIGFSLRGDLAADPIGADFLDSTGTLVKQYRWNSLWTVGTRVSFLFTWDGTDFLLYVDGVAKVPTNLDTDDSGSQTDTGRRISIGSVNDTVNFIGLIHSTSIWNVALTSAEVTALQNGASPHSIDNRFDFGDYASSSNLQHYWRHGLDASDIGKDYGYADTLIDVGDNAVDITSDDIVDYRINGFEDTKALDFDGSTEHLYNASNNVLGIANEWSIQINNEPAVDDTNIYLFRAEPNVVTNSLIGIFQDGSLANDPLTVTILRANGSSLKHYSYNNTYTVGTKVSYIITWDGTNLLLYVDGVLTAPDLLTNDYDSTMDDSPRRISVGSAVGGVPYDGLIHSTSMWDVALTQAEVTALQNGSSPQSIDNRYNFGAYVSKDNLQHYWRHGFDAGDFGKDYGNASLLIDIGDDATNITSDDIVEYGGTNDSSVFNDKSVFNGGFDEARYYDRALNIQEIEALFYNPTGKLDRTLSGDWKITTSFGESFSPTVEPAIDFVADSALAGEKYLRLGSGAAGDGDADGLSIVYKENIPFSPTIRYKMTVKARDGYSTLASNCYIGVIGISNTGTDLVGLSDSNDAVGTDSWEYMSAIVQSPGATPAESGSLSTDWVEFIAVYGGNTSISGLGATDATADHRYGNGGNTAQLFSVGGVAKNDFTWANPAHLHGSLAVATQQGSGNTAYVRPMIVVNHADIDDSTHIDYIKIEQQKDATLTASVGPVFQWPGKSLSDSGKIGTSPTSAWVTKYVQDSRYYQVFSYVIKSGLSIETYNELVKKLVHPAGLAMFARVNIQGLASVSMAPFDQTIAGVVDLLKIYYMGAESVLLGASSASVHGVGVTYKTTFGLPATVHDAFDLDLAHGQTPHGAGNNTPGSPGWIAWGESLESVPFANNHYYFGADVTAPPGGLWPSNGHYTTSTERTTVTKDTLIWHISDDNSLLVSAFQNANVGAIAGQFMESGHAESKYQKGWFAQATGAAPGSQTDDEYAHFWPASDNGAERLASGFTCPLDIDGGVYRYVRMKIRRVGPGGYGAASWHGACQADTNPTSFGSLFAPSLHADPTSGSGTGALGDWTGVAANTVSQPSTFILPSDVDAGAKSAWHVFEWDMWQLGTYDDAVNEVIYPNNGGENLTDNKMWKWANSSTGTSQQDGGTGRRIGSISFHLCYSPDNNDEKFEIEWIQVDNGAGWPRGSYALPVGWVGNTASGISSSGAGTGGMGAYNKIRVSDSIDQSTQSMGNFAVSAEPTVTFESEVEFNFPVIYVCSNKRIVNDAMIDRVFDANGAIFRVSGTAHNEEWVTTEIIDSEKFLRTVNTIAGTVTGGGQPVDDAATYIGADITANGHFTGPVILDTDENDNLYIGYIYEHDDAGSPTYPGLVDKDDPKPLMLFRLTPMNNVQATLATTADPHNLYANGVGPAAEPRGRSNTYIAEQILWGNTGGVDGIGTMTGGNDYNLEHGSSSEREIAGTSMIVDFGTDDFGSLYTLGAASQNIIKILPASNGSYGNAVTQFISPLGGQLPGRKVIEIANTSMLDANNQILGDESSGKSWTPIQIIKGPKDSIFVACDTAYDELRGGFDGAAPFADWKYSKSVYCYHVVVSQNVATGTYSTKNVYPVFSNTGSQQLLTTTGSLRANLAGLQESCAGMVLDNNDPPNLYYMTSNNMYRITPKGYSYQEGDATIEKVFPERYFEDTLHWPENKMGMLGWASTIDSGAANGVWQENYQHIQCDSRNRIFFAGRSNLYCYSRGTNTQFSDSIMYNVSNTEFSTLNVVANTDMYTDNISWNMGISGLTNVSIDNFVLGERGIDSAAERANSHSEGVYFVMHGYDGEGGSAYEHPRALCVVYPNADGSFVSDEGGQLALTLMSQDPASNTQFAVNGTGGVNRYRGKGPALIALRPEKTK